MTKSGRSCLAVVVNVVLVAGVLVTVLLVKVLPPHIAIVVIV